MPEAKWSTCREWVVAPGQHVRIELDLFHGGERPIVFEPLNTGSSLEWLDNKTFLYKCPVKSSYVRGSRDGFMLMAGNEFDRFSVVIHPDYVRSTEQQARERSLGASSAPTGPDPRLSEAATKLRDMADWLEQ